MNVTNTDGGHIERSINAEAEQTDSVGRDTDRLPKGMVVLLHDAFLSEEAMHVVCVEGQAKEWLSVVIPRLQL
jgi:hypothetical protein